MQTAVLMPNLIRNPRSNVESAGYVPRKHQKPLNPAPIPGPRTSAWVCLRDVPKLLMTGGTADA
jgi:hypothetical protein